MTEPQEKESLLVNQDPDDPPFSELPFSQKLRYMKRIASAAYPLICAFITPSLANLVNLFWLIRNEDNAEIIGGYGLGVVWSNSWVNAFVVSINQALNVLVARAFGAKEYSLCGLYYQRSIVILITCLLPFFTILWYSEPILEMLNIESVLASNASIFTQHVLPALLMNAFFDSMKNFIVAQKHFKIIYLIQGTTFSLHLFWSWFFINHLQLSILGAAYARICEETLNMVLIYLYIKIKSDFKKTWTFTLKGFNCSQLLRQFKFSIPMGSVTYLEFFYYEFMTVLASEFGAQQTVAHVATAQLSSLCFTFFIGNSIGIMSLIGNALGEKKPNKANNTAKMGYISLFLTFLVIFGIIRLLCNQWAQFWSTDPNEVSYILECVFVYQIGAQPNDAMVNSFLSSLKAIGKQCLAGWGVVFSYYGIAGPLSFLFAFYLGYEVLGIWIAFGIANYVMFLFYLVIVCQINWDKAVDDAHKMIAENKPNVMLIPGDESIIQNAGENLLRSEIGEPVTNNEGV